MLPPTLATRPPPCRTITSALLHPWASARRLYQRPLSQQVSQPWLHCQTPAWSSQPTTQMTTSDSIRYGVVVRCSFTLSLCCSHLQAPSPIAAEPVAAPEVCYHCLYPLSPLLIPPCLGSPAHSLPTEPTDTIHLPAQPCACTSPSLCPCIAQWQQWQWQWQ
jgi:hypothetical protein